MNVRSKTTWALTLAAITLSLTSACGSETSTTGTYGCDEVSGRSSRVNSCVGYAASTSAA